MRFRVFAALELPRYNQAQLGEVLAGLQTAVPPGTVRWVRPEVVHLTLKFYGDVPAEDVPAMETALAEAAGQGQAMTLSLTGLGVFPNPRRPQVIWVGVAGDLDTLFTLQGRVEAVSEALGYAPEARAYKPHLTLGRVNGTLSPGEHVRLMEALQARRDDVFGAFQAETLSLVRSDLRPNGPVYTNLWAAALGSPQGQTHQNF